MTEQLTTADRESVAQDLEAMQDALVRHQNTEPLSGRFKEWSEHDAMLVREIARLERLLDEDA